MLTHIEEEVPCQPETLKILLQTKLKKIIIDELGLQLDIIFHQKSKEVLERIVNSIPDLIPSEILENRK